jgi:hypothetical protein
LRSFAAWWRALAESRGGGAQPAHSEGNGCKGGDKGMPGGIFLVFHILTPLKVSTQYDVFTVSKSELYFVSQLKP